MVIIMNLSMKWLSDYIDTGVDLKAVLCRYDNERF